MASLVAHLGRRWPGAPWAPTLADAAWLLGCGLLFWASKWLGKQFEGIPGHASAFWIPVLFLAADRVRQPGRGTLAALLGSFLWTLPRANPLAVAPYLAAGLALDACAPRAERLRRPGFALLVGAACSLAKYAVHNLPGAVLGVGHFLTWGAAQVALLHLLFGLVGGGVGCLLLRALPRRPE